jgi:hypothetical protein
MVEKASNGAMPAGMPMLARGRHSRPNDGSCLMEYVSVLSGGRHSDRPRCTHALLAWMARRVNDAVSDAARPTLGVLAPDLIGTRSRGRRGCAQVRAVVYLELSAAGLTAAPDEETLGRVHELARAHLEGDRTLRPVGTIDRNLVFQKALEALGEVDPPCRDRLLGEALASAVARTRHVLGLPGPGAAEADPRLAEFA